MNTVYVLWIRQLKKYFRSKSRIIGSLGQPILFLVSFGFGFGSVYQRAGESNYIQFLAPGIICMSVLFTAIFTGIDIIWDRQFGFLKEILVAPVPRIHIVIGKALGGATVAVIQGILVFIITLFVGFRPVNYQNIFSGLAILFLTAILFTSLGICIASIIEDMQGFQLIMNFLVMPTIFLSGAFFSLKGLPLPIEIISKIDPLTYGVDAFRGLLTGMYTLELIKDVTILGLYTTILLFLGSILFEKIQP